MRHRVTLQGPSRTTDGQGGYTSTMTDIGTFWASIEPTSGFEKFQAGQNETPITHKIMMRYDSRITTAKRLLFGSRVFQIKECLNVEERGAFLKLLCIETL
jgi:SPP1 family predicted phage head-tail adaptor